MLARVKESFCGDPMNEGRTGQEGLRLLASPMQTVHPLLIPVTCSLKNTARGVKRHCIGCFAAVDEYAYSCVAL